MPALIIIRILLYFPVGESRLWWYEIYILIAVVAGFRYKEDERITHLGLKAIEALYFHAKNLIQNGEWDQFLETINICSDEEQR